MSNKLYSQDLHNMQAFLFPFAFFKGNDIGVTNFKAIYIA